ncbi:MAG: NADH-quinone oxidoreductase subunit NuoI [Deltaproteobacteria bacterium]
METREKDSYLKKTADTFTGLVQGLGVTLTHLFKRNITLEYPEEKRELPPRTRARIVLTRDPDGKERCVACFLCAAACPVSCISMDGDENDDGRRYARWFRINFARCIYCGLCEEACPTLAIQLTPYFEFCDRKIINLLAEKEDLLVDHGGKNNEYNFYKYAGVIMEGKKGSHINEKEPVDIKSNLP